MKQRKKKQKYVFSREDSKEVTEGKKHHKVTRHAQYNFTGHPQKRGALRQDCPVPKGA